MSEIDDIFAAKPKGNAKPTALVASTSTIPTAEPSKKSKKKRKDKIAKRKREADDDGDSQPAKRRVPETVLDPSVNTQPAAASNKIAPTKSAKAAKLEKLAAGGATKTKRGKIDKEEEARFKDSRGNGPRRKTEEGFTIYKEDELGISNTGGDTPLCPFDCSCCF